MSPTDRWRYLKVDTKENERTHALWFEDGDLAQNIPGTFAHEGFRHTRQQLEVGDFAVELRCDPFLFVPELRVESKTWDDLLASLRDDSAGRADSRIRYQLDKLIEANMKGVPVAVMVVGEMEGLEKGIRTRVRGTKWHTTLSASYWELHAALLAIEHLGILVFFAPSEALVPRALRMAAEIVERREHFPPPGLARVALLTPKLSQLARTLTAVEGIGAPTAAEIARHFKASFPLFWEATTKDLQEVKGVGKIMAQRIHAHFHDIPDEAEADESFEALERQYAS